MNLATVEVIEEIRPHSNADKLELARVRNFWCIVQKETFREGDKVIYVRPDSQLPADREWAAPFLRYTKRGRLRAVRLRGEWSEGLILSCDQGLEQYEDVTDTYGVTKYEAPVKFTPENARGGLPFDMPRTDEERWQNLRNLDELIGQEVVVTLKIDGQSFTAYTNVVDGERVEGICSRSLDLRIGDGFDSNWHAAERKYNILKKMEDRIPDSWNCVAIRGEIYGHGIQSLEHNPHSKVPLDFAMYSVWDMWQRRYSDWDTVEWLSKELGIPHVPVLERTTLTRELIEKYDSQLTEVNGQPFEGVVVKGKGFSFKIINKHYDSNK